MLFTDDKVIKEAKETTDIKRIEALSKHILPDVRLNIAKNVFSPIHILKRLERDGYYNVRDSATKTIKEVTE